uniref:Uncharacterized protein n=1 Tax=Panagrolaimus superbus TaxID=310955 RepID=A0A914Y1Y3_9BILA
MSGFSDKNNNQLDNIDEEDDESESAKMDEIDRNEVADGNDGYGRGKATTATKATATTSTTTEKANEIDAIEFVLNLFGSNDTEDNSTASSLTTKDDIATVPNLEDVDNKTVLWIDATYKALDHGMNITLIPECEVWQEYWDNNSTTLNLNETEVGESDEINLGFVEYELIDKKSRLEEVGLDKDMLKNHSVNIFGI